jgi:hypothetical protein
MWYSEISEVAAFCTHARGNTHISSLRYIDDYVTMTVTVTKIMTVIVAVTVKVTAPYQPARTCIIMRLMHTDINACAYLYSVLYMILQPGRYRDPDSFGWQHAYHAADAHTSDAHKLASFSSIHDSVTVTVTMSFILHMYVPCDCDACM